MKKIKLSFFIILISTAAFSQQKMAIMSYNIRYDNPKDGADNWQYRKANLASILQFYDVVVCGMQEVLYSQIEDLQKLLPNYNYVGVGRTDGKLAGEFSPIFYDKNKFTIIKTETFWLSPTPNIPGQAWDAMLPRIVTWAKFKPKKGKSFYVFNSHFDHVGKVARRESALLLLAKVKEIAGKEIAIITGDFNAEPQEEPTQIINNSLIDTKKITQMPHFGPDSSSFNGFENKEIKNRLIDYIFVNSPKIKVWKHATIANTWAGRFASDHHAILAEISF